MAIQKFKPGDKVKFTQKAKDRFGDGKYWKYGNFSGLDLNKIYTVKANTTHDWPSYQLHDCSIPYVAAYLLEPAETEQTKKKMTKKEFILALVQAILPDQSINYEGCKPYAKVHLDKDAITVRCSKSKEGKVNLTLSPMYGTFEKTDIELVTDFLKQRCDLDYSKDAIKVTDRGDLVIPFIDYPWNFVDEIKPLRKLIQEENPNPCDICEIVRKLQAEIQRLKYELDQAKAKEFHISSDWHKKPRRATVTFEF